MKLISKTLLYYLLISLPLLLLAGALSYYLINSELRDGVDESLQGEKNKAEQFIHTFSEPHAFSLADRLSNIQPVQQQVLPSGYSDTLIYDSIEKELVNFRMLRTYYTFQQQLYQITILKTTFEEEELMEGILSSFALILGFLVIAFVIVNVWLTKKLWSPFHKTLAVLNTYDIKNHELHDFDPVNILEFDQLNDALTKMTSKIHSDYQQQKEFTENAAHELQTPLAVIKVSTELLMQSPHLKAEEMNRLQVIDNTIKKMVSLNKALILLSKIENNQFHENEAISFKQVVTKSVAAYADLLEAKNLAVDLQVETDVVVHMNPALADILMSNLLQNAIRHNQKGGQVRIELKDKQLLISNSGEALSISAADLFVRFKKNDASADSLGLGLSIVKGIVDCYGFTVSYQYVDGLHQFCIEFKDSL